MRQVRAEGLDLAIDRLQAEDQPRARQLIAEHGLAPFAERARASDVLENLYYLELLLTATRDLALPERPTVIDVGVSHWFYAPALVAALRPSSALGFESDPWRMYGDGHTRADWAAWYTQGLDATQFIPRDVLTWVGRADLALMLFPFVFVDDADRWGLPRWHFDPLGLLRHVWSLCDALVVVNQGEREAAEQQRLFEAAAIRATGPVRFDSAFWRYDLPRFISVARRP